MGSGKAALAAGMLEAYPCQSERGQSPFQRQPHGAESLMSLSCVLLENKYFQYSLFKHALLSLIRGLSGDIRGFGIGSNVARDPGIQVLVSQCIADSGNVPRNRDHSRRRKHLGC